MADALTQFTATFPGRFESLEKISAFIGKVARSAGLDESTTYNVQLAVDEACSNIIEHAYGGEDLGNIECFCELTPEELKITLSDQGQPFDPTQIPEPDITSPPEERKVGGLGLFLIQKFMDEVQFAFEPGKNTLTMIKYR